VLRECSTALDSWPAPSVGYNHAAEPDSQEGLGGGEKERSLLGVTRREAREHDER